MCITYHSNNHKSWQEWKMETKRKIKGCDSQTTETLSTSANLELVDSMKEALITSDLSALTSFLEKKSKE